MKLRSLIVDNGISQRELARAIERSEPFVSRLLAGETGASQETIERVLSFLSQRLSRSVSYEEAFLASPGAAA